MESRSTWNPSEFLTHVSWVRSLALSLVRDTGQADDLVQETLVAALERRPADDRPLRPWLRSVVHNRAAFWRRGEAHRRAREEQASRPESLPSSEDLLEVAEAHGRLVQALTRLRDPYRTALLLRFYEELSPAEIARRQGLPAATVRSQLRRGLEELRSELDGLHEGDRRAWSLALVPLAVEAPPAPSPAPTLLSTLRAMNPITHLALASSLVVLAGVLVVSRLEPASAPTARAPAAPAGVGLDDRDESAIVEQGETLVIEVGLEPGWGARIEAVDRATGAPLPGVEVVLDGEAAGVTDAVGRIDLVQPAAPERIDLGLAGWHFDSGSYAPATGKPEGFAPAHRVAFAVD